ncbi:NADP(H)-dependent aldo-keto reductase [Pelagibius sp. 7325]|uniref:NADP(H)-dependent aldo-keto reductase n=1 Tax=Pelagibius sp. 7325 TaxID=3131994 RepID=UPI0030EE314D
MEYRRLGRTDVKVSAICLGSMTWGEQNSEQEGFQQLDYALDQGVNFIDTAEMYPIATRAETYGRTEEIIGNWMAARGTRDKVIIATKIVGPNAGRFPYIRGGETRFDRKHIAAAVEASLKRLKTDTIDLYQLHWPDRATNDFGKLAYQHEDGAQETPIEETLEALDVVVKAGKVRHVGLSNENPWGVMRFVTGAEQGKGPRVASVQNPYSLLNRSFETRMAEVAIREDVGLLAYAPLAAGTLTGKYLNDQWPAGARRTLWPDNRRYQGPQADKATAAYVQIARDHGLDPAALALAFVLRQRFLTAAIIGATTLDQLKTDIGAAEVSLSDDLLAALEDIHKRYTYPCP